MTTIMAKTMQVKSIRIKKSRGKLCSIFGKNLQTHHDALAPMVFIPRIRMVKVSKLAEVIMPDLRWDRDALNAVSKLEYDTKRKLNNQGPYSPSHVKGASMLGEAQWQWLEQELKKPAAIKLIASSLQLLPDFTGWESWANFPDYRKRLFHH